MKSLRNLNFKKNRDNTLEAVVTRHPRGVKKVTITGAGRLRECKITEFVWELRKQGFVIAVVSRAVRLRECPLGQLAL